MAAIKNEVPGDQALAMLKEGNSRFVTGQPVYDWHDLTRREALGEGQAPYAILLSCADSRVVPELAFDTRIGDLFVVRVAGNIANTSSLASIEYAVSAIETKRIVVLGHEKCGAVGAALAGGDCGYNLNHLLSHLTPALSSCPSESDVNVVVRENAKLTAQGLRDRSSIISSAADVVIQPAFYNLVSGQVDWL